jgi:hypothetical protein
MKRVLVICAIALAFCATQAWAGPTVKPYGFVLFNYQFNSSWNGDIPVLASEYDEETPNHLLTARQSRLGFKVMSEARFSPMGKIELDFWGLTGSAPAGGVLQSAPRLRVAFLTLSFMDGSLKVTMGQDWVKAFAPLSPSSIAHVSIPEFSGSGNLWNRLPQIRADFTQEVGPGKLLVSVAACRPFGADIDPHDPYGAGDQEPSQGDYLGAGELSLLPFGQGRVAFSYENGVAVTVGVSGHGGQMDFSQRKSRWIGDPRFGHREHFNEDELDEKVNTWAVAGDVNACFGVVGISGEAFYGRNLGMYFSNAGVGYVSTSLYIVGIHTPKAMGGWGQVTIKPPESPVKINAGAGLEQLNKDDLGEWDGWMGAVGQNMTFFGNVMCMAVEGCVFSIEYGMIQTKRVTSAKKAFEAEFEDDAAINHSVNIGCQMKF